MEIYWTKPLTSISYDAGTMPLVENADSYANASVATILEAAREVIERAVDNHPAVFETSALCLAEVPHFHRNEIVVGHIVGRGGFCVVKEINEIRLQSKVMRDGRADGGEVDSSGKWSMKGRRSYHDSRSSLDRSQGSVGKTDTDIASRELLARRVLAKKGGKFVIKQVEPALLNTDRVTYLKGIVDLAMETKYLASLDHPNILKLRGVAWDNSGCAKDYFLVLDRLQETLPKKLNSWMNTDRATKGITGFLTGGKRKASGLLTERILVAYDIAVGMAYIHRQDSVAGLYCTCVLRLTLLFSIVQPRGDIQRFKAGSVYFRLMRLLSFPYKFSLNDCNSFVNFFR